MVVCVPQGNVQTGSTLITNVRHYHALIVVWESLEDIEKGMDNKLPGDLLVSDIQ